MNTKLIILGYLLIATVMEVCGDSLLRVGINHTSPALRLACFATGAVLLFGYGLLVNLAPIEFGRVAGIYIATLFIVWQAGNYIAFRTLPTVPILVGGSLIIAGGLIVAFWTSPSAAD